MSNKTAKQMFKDLGYKVNEQPCYLCYYTDNGEITFFHSSKTISKIGKKDYAYLRAINMRELIAINKQIEELGWDISNIGQLGSSGKSVGICCLYLKKKLKKY